MAADIEYRGALRRPGRRLHPARRRPHLGRRHPARAGALARRHAVAPALEARRVPAAVFRLPRDLLARFLNRALGASRRWRPQHGEPGRLVVGTRSRGLVHDLQHLLLRFGIVSTVSQSVVAVDQATWLAHDLVVDEPDQLVALATHIGLLGHEAELGAVVAHARSVAERRPCRPGEGGAGAGGAAAGPDGGAVLWDTVVDLEDEGDEHVYDLTVPGTHNFVAADVFVHNTSFASAWAPTRPCTPTGRSCCSASRWAASSCPSACCAARPASTRPGSHRPAQRGRLEPHQPGHRPPGRRPHLDRRQPQPHRHGDPAKACRLKSQVRVTSAWWWSTTCSS